LTHWPFLNDAAGDYLVLDVKEKKPKTHIQLINQSIKLLFTFRIQSIHPQACLSAVTLSLTTDRNSLKAIFN